jgi:hypothetical protein
MALGKPSENSGLMYGTSCSRNQPTQPCHIPVTPVSLPHFTFFNIFSNKSLDYVNPEGAQNPLPTYPETERMIQIWNVLWDKKVEDAKASDPKAEYHPSKEDVEKMIREAASITNQSAPNHLPAPILTESLADGSTPTVPGHPGGYFQPGYHHTTLNFHGDDANLDINPSALHHSDTFSQNLYNTNYDDGLDDFDLSTIRANNPNLSTLDFTNPDQVACFNSLVQNMPSDS